MALSTRDYLLEKNGMLRRVPRRVVESMIGGEDAMPQFAGETLRAVTVIFENDGGKPTRILDAQGSYWAFDNDGKINRSLSDAAFEFMDVAFNKPDRSSKVVSLTPEIKRRDVKARHRWDVTKDILDRISADIWPGIAGQAAEVTSITGKLPKRPPLTSEARRILPDIAARLSLIETDLRMLSEPALARRTAEFGEDNQPLWKGLAEACDRQREILRRRRLGTGIWFAVLEVFRQVSEIESRSVFLAHEKCDGKEQAVDAARKLLVMHADKFSDDYSIEVNVYPDLEWQPMEE
jgi:hypothetical protein